MDFQTAVRTCLTKKYAGFQGRASRSEYWWFVLAVVIGSFLSLFLGPLAFIFTLAILCPMLAVGSRRLQDTGRPGWWIVIPAALGLVSNLLAPNIPENPEAIVVSNPGGILFFALISIIQLIVTIIFIWWLTRPSDPETNAYGPPPAPQN